MPVLSATAFLRRPTIAVFAAAGLGSAAFAAGLGVAFDLTPPVYRALPLVLMGGFIALGIGLAITRADGAPSVRTGLVFSAVAGFVFAFILGAKWCGAVSSDVLLGGILPSLDASSYFQGALNFLDGGRLTPLATVRPLMPLHLAGLLELTRGSFHLSVAILTALMAAGVVLVAATVARMYGTSAACIGVAVLLPFLLPTIGTTMTENIGFTLGAAGFALMGYASTNGKEQRRRGAVLFACGLTLCSLGLSARAGAMFVLPLMVLYAGKRFRTEMRFAFGPAALAALGATGAMLLNFAATHMLGTPGEAGFSNFSFTLYGLATGGESWIQAYRDFPRLLDLPPGERGREAYRLAINHMAAHPFDLMVGIAHRYNDFFINTRWFQFEGLGGTRVVFALFALSGIVATWRNRHEATAAFILTGTVGVWLSVPFIGDGGTRVHAVTVGFTAALVAAGAAFIFRRFVRASDATTAPTAALPIGAMILATIVLATLGAALAGRKNGNTRLALPQCSADTTALALITVPDAALDITDGDIPRRALRTTAVQLAAARRWKFAHDDAILRLQRPVRVGLAQIPVSGDQFTVASPFGVPLPARFTACARKIPGVFILERISPRS